MNELPTTVIERLLILNPAYDADNARRAVAGLYATPPDWLPLCEKFNIPRVETRRWLVIAQAGQDVGSHIAHWLALIGVTESLLSR